MKIDKDVLQQAMEEIMDEDLERMNKSMDNEDLNQQIEDAKKRMDWEELYQKGQEPDKAKNISWQKAAAIFLILFLAGSSTTYAIGKILRTGAEWDVTYGISEDTFMFESEGTPMGTATPDATQKEAVSKTPPKEIEVYYEPAYIPKGYEEMEEDAGSENGGKDSAFTYYIKEEKKGKIKVHSILVTQSVLNGTISIDSKNMTRETVYINGWKGQLNYKKNKIAIIWTTEEYVFSAHSYGDVSVEELLKVARSFRPIEKN